MAMNKKYLFYDSQAAKSEGKESLLEGNPVWLWNDRLLLVEHERDDKFWRFTALDLITNETRPVHFIKSQSEFRQIDVITLNKDYGFIIESAENVTRVTLVMLKWAPGEFQLVEQFEQAGRFFDILVNSLNPTKFVLRQKNGFRYVYQTCALDSGKIEFGDDVYGSNIFFQHYFNNKLYALDRNVRVHTYDWLTKKRDSVAINGLPADMIDHWRTEWIKNRLYVVRFNDPGMDGIAYIDLETLNWNFLDFVTNMRIYEMQYFDGNLIVYADNYDDYYSGISRFNFKIYSVPIQHPQSLRKMVWPLVVQGFKRDKSIDDPYKAASRFLPFNSDLRPDWYKEETALEISRKASNGQSQDQSKLSQQLPDDVSLERIKFD